MDDVAHGENSSRDQTLRDSYVWKLDLGREGSNGEKKQRGQTQRLDVFVYILYCRLDFEAVKTFHIFIRMKFNLRR